MTADQICYVKDPGPALPVVQHHGGLYILIQMVAGDRIVAAEDVDADIARRGAGRTTLPRRGGARRDGRTSTVLCSRASGWSGDAQPDVRGFVRRRPNPRGGVL